MSVRAGLLRERREAEDALGEILPLLESLRGNDRRRIDRHADLYRNALAGAEDAYARELQPAPISRCPLTGSVVVLPIDTVDLDGPWWDASAPIRPDHQLPGTVFGITGSVALGEPLAWAPFECRPGPEVPFVIPHVLSATGVGAVLSSIPIGPHRGFVVVYYASEYPHGVASPGIWDGEGTYSPRRYDSDLLPWLESGKLGWIAPADPELLVRAGAGDCPYAGLPGRRAPSVIRFGIATWIEGGST